MNERFDQVTYREEMRQMAATRSKKPASDTVIVNGCLMLTGVDLIGLPYLWSTRIVRSLPLATMRVPGSAKALALYHEGAHGLVDAWVRYKQLTDSQAKQHHAMVDALDLAHEPRTGRQHDAVDQQGARRAGGRKTRLPGTRATT